jgi:hypothetical protein
MFDQGMTCREIAEKLGIQRQTVKDHLVLARKHPVTPKRKDSPAIQEARRIDAAMREAIASEPVSPARLIELFPKLTRSQIKKALYRLQDLGQAKSHGRGKYVVWGHPDVLQTHAERRAQEMRDAAALRQKMAEKPVRQAVNFTAQPSAPVVSISAGKPQSTIDYSKAMITIIPTPKGRYHVDMPKGSGVISQDWHERRACST